MHNDDQRLLKSVRVRQIAFITVGVVTSLAAPLGMMVGEYGAWISLMTLAAWLVVPVAYYVFVVAFEVAVERFATAPRKTQGSLRLFAALIAVPGLGTVLEVVLLHRLAKESTRLPGAADRSTLVLLLALVRPVASIMLMPFAMLLIGTFSDDSWMIVMVLNPLLNLAILAVITQVIVTPLLDQMVPDQGPTDLASAGAVSSMAVSSSTRGSERG